MSQHDYWFYTSNFLRLEGANEGEPFLSGQLRVSEEFLSHVLLDREYKPLIRIIMQTTATIGHTDLLSGILKVQVRNEEKITEQDRIYCQNQQDELYKTLAQIAWWYNIFKR